jgi:hypothetical protein
VGRLHDSRQEWTEAGAGGGVCGWFGGGFFRGGVGGERWVCEVVTMEDGMYRYGGLEDLIFFGFAGGGDEREGWEVVWWFRGCEGSWGMRVVMFGLRFWCMRTLILV